jgi:adenylate kinase
VRIVLMGPPGAGKGTQAKRLKDRFSMAHLSSGDIFREVRSSGSELGERLAKYMDAGELVPDDIVVTMMADAIKNCDAEGGMMLDGFPRTVPQAEALDEQLSQAGQPLDAVVVIQVDDDLIVNRITGRRSCPACGRVYHVEFMPPKQPGVCDVDGEALVQRDDDKEEVVRQRLDAYHKQTAPVIDYYRGRGTNVIAVDGNGSPDDVTASLEAALEPLA